MAELTQDSSAVKPLLRGWLHLVWFELALVAGAVWLQRVSPAHRWVVAVYVVAAAGLFGTSALYHRGAWRPPVHRTLQRADHAMIFVLIAGTATPVAWLTMGHQGATVTLAIIWTATGAALFTHVRWMEAPELLVGTTFVVLGCSGVAVLPGVWTTAGVTPFVLMLAGGVVYIIGALLYHVRWPDPWPTVFGYHEAFHVLVCAAATLQYCAIAGYIV